MERTKTVSGVTGVMPVRALLETKLKAFHEFMSATAMLMDRLDTENPTEIERLIEQREILISKIDRIDSAIIACGKGSSTSLGSELGLESLVRSISEVAHKASRINDRCLRTLADRLDTLRNELSRSPRPVRRSVEYLARTGSPARFFDIKT
jgi:hypothetical protein